MRKSQRQALAANDLPRDCLVCYCRLDEGAGVNASDASGTQCHWVRGIAGANQPSWVAEGLDFGSDVLVGPIKRFRDVKTIVVVLKPGVKSLAQTVLAPDGTNSTPRLYPASNQMLWNASPNASNKGVTPISGWNCLAWDYQSPRMRFWINGLPEVGYREDNPTVYPSNSGDIKLYVGAVNPGQSDNFAGKIAAFALFNRQLNPAEHMQVFRYLQREVARRGIVLGSDFSPTSSMYAILSDSIADGVGDSSASGNPSWSYQAALAMTGNYPGANLGLPGDFLAFAVDTHTATQYRKKTADVLLNIWNGATKALFCDLITNDLGTSGLSGAACYALMKQLMTEARAAGWTALCVGDCHPRADTAWSPAKETERLNYNALLAADFPNHDSANMWTGASWADKLVKKSLATNLQDPTNTLYFNADKLHGTPLGYTAIKAEYQPAFTAFNFT
jgi:hypothetical protein